jgi:hypothetical protein
VLTRKRSAGHTDGKKPMVPRNLEREHIRVAVNGFNDKPSVVTGASQVEKGGDADSCPTSAAHPLPTHRVVHADHQQVPFLERQP